VAADDPTKTPPNVTNPTAVILGINTSAIDNGSSKKEAAATAEVTAAGT